MLLVVKFLVIVVSVWYFMVISVVDVNGVNGGLVYMWGYGESG